MTYKITILGVSKYSSGESAYKTYFFGWVFTLIIIHDASAFSICYTKSFRGIMRRENWLL